MWNDTSETYVFLQLQCKCVSHDNYPHRSQELFQATQQDDAETVGRIVAEIERIRNGYKLSAPELTQNGANLWHYALRNGRKKVIVLADVYNCTYL